jgi:hypothetical protein
MATTPGSRRRETRTDITGEDRNTLSNMQQPLGSMDTPGSSTSDVNEVNLGPTETARRTGNLGATNTSRGVTPDRSGRSFTATFAIVAAVMVVAFLLALYLGNNRSDVATAPATTQAPVAATGTGTTDDTTGSTSMPSTQTAPGSGAASDTTGGTSGTAMPPPANP